jgi:hypothetical protein
MKMWIALCFAALPALAAGPAGTWSIDGMIGDFPIQAVCNLTEKDNRLGGSCTAQGADFPITGSVAGNDVTWSYEVDYQGQHLVVTYKATLDSPSSMKGTVSVMIGEFHRETAAAEGGGAPLRT